MRHLRFTAAVGTMGTLLELSHEVPGEILAQQGERLVEELYVVLPMDTIKAMMAKLAEKDGMVLVTREKAAEVGLV